MLWTAPTHKDFPPAFRAAAKTFLLCAAADSNRRRVEEKEEQREEEVQEEEGLSLGDMPQEVLLHVIELAAVPLSGWIGVPLDDDAREEEAAPEAAGADASKAGRCKFELC
jgi:hypothetical protein